MTPLVETTAQASQGGFRGIKKFRGLFVKQSDEPEKPPPSWASDTLLVYADFEDVTILEMFEGEDDFELKDNKLRISVPYAKPGKTPTANSIWTRTWVASAEELGEKTKGRKMKPSEFVGQYVTLEKQRRFLFNHPKVEKDANGKDAVVLDEAGQKVMEEVHAEDQTGRPNRFCFTVDEAETDIKGYARSVLIGKTQQAALRELIIDNRLKTHGELKDRLKDGTLADYLGLKLVDEKFQP